MSGPRSYKQIRKEKELAELRAAQGQYDQYKAQQARQGMDDYAALSQQGKIQASTDQGKQMRFQEAKARVQNPNVVSSQNIGGKLSAANSAMSMLNSQGGPTDAAGGAMGGAMQGASAGMAFGPKGAIIGGIAGAGMGILKAKQARKQALAKIEAEKELGLAAVEERKADRMNNALMSLQNAFSSTLI
jgi:hypothetical protein